MEKPQRVWSRDQLLDRIWGKMYMLIHGLLMCTLADLGRHYVKVAPLILCERFAGLYALG